MGKNTAGLTGAFAHVYFKVITFWHNFVRYQVPTYLESVTYCSLTYKYKYLINHLHLPSVTIERLLSPV